MFEKNLQHKHETLKELLGPIKMQLIRSKIALEHYKTERHSFKEKILKECNETVRNTLLTKGHLIPSDLVDSAADLYLIMIDGYKHIIVGEKKNMMIPDRLFL